MSDCSTNAVKVPSCFVPKTCGNCGHCVPVVGHCDDGNMEVDLHDHVCDSWIERTDTLDQRYERLAQVALNMYSTIRAMLNISCKNEGLSSKERKCVINEETAIFREKLKDLGVSVDE